MKTKKIYISVALCFLTLFLLYFHNTSNSNSEPEVSSSRTEPKVTGSTGDTFSGQSVHTFSADKLKFSSFALVDRVSSREKAGGTRCEKWAVLTTIFKPSEAVRRQVRLKDWCLVIVGDNKSPSTYETGWMKGEGNNEVVYLSPEDQKAINDSFVDSLPWNHFGRKNVGFLYAIMHGAQVIWDFDDDNMLKFWIPDAAPPGAPSLDAVIPKKNRSFVDVRTLLDHGYPTYNPYPILGAPTLPSWPRGIPLVDIKRSERSGTPLKEVRVHKESIGVLQSLADYQPDVDAIFRITNPIPFSFTRMEETKPLMIPAGVLTPYNAQATLHFRDSFWALLLPVTVHGRVSDIWRSYIAQRLFWDTGLLFGFMARPLVVQDRNPHSNLADLDAEKDLYMKSEHLADFLGSWRGRGRTLVERIEELWVALYEHDYLKIHDVELVQLWIQSLLDVGYQFPVLKDRHSSVPTDAGKSMIMTREGDHDQEEGACEIKSSLTFWTSDLHDGTRIDMPSVLANLGQNTIVSGTKSNSPYPFVFKMDHISQYLSRRSDVIKRQYVRHSKSLTEKMVQENYEFYKTDKHIASVDAFFCEFPASMCELWMPFNKTIVFLPAHRYNLGRCTKDEWHRLNEHLYKLASMENPKHIIAASSVYDREYLHHYTGLDPVPLYSFSGFYTANNTYNPTRDEILLIGHKISDFKSSKKFVLKDPHELYGHYQLSDLVHHRAAVLIAYSVMSYKLTEYYSLAIPLFVPSMKFYQNVRHFGPDRSSLSRFYCKNEELDSHIEPHPSSTHPYSPNIQAEDDQESEYYWLQFSDFYQWPHIVYFDDIPDLERKLDSADFNRMHDLMMLENEKRKETLLYNWCRVINKIKTGQTVPKSYKQAIAELYNVSRLQVN